ncbi:MAG: hypothetical protein H0U73_05525 [Tatlockia sp.]|nr:hypothetical protein [Tatlockia sp.]
MKSNNSKIIKSRVTNVIEQLFEQSDNKEIPDITEICSRAKTNRKVALKYLYQWWEQQAVNSPFADWLTGQSEYSALEQSLQGILNSLDCQIKELDIYNEELNFIPNTIHPLGNHLINSLLIIKDEVSYALKTTERAREDHEVLENTLRQKVHECDRLTRELNGIQASHTRKLSLLREELDASRRESTAAKLLAKSLKRRKKSFSLKRVYVPYKLDGL